MIRSLRRTAPLAALLTAGALAAPARATVGDLTPLPGLAACNAATGLLTGTCLPGSPIGPQASPTLGSAASNVVPSPDGRHVYVVAAANAGGGVGRIGVFTRSADGALSPSSCVVAVGESPPLCASSGSADVDAAIRNADSEGATTASRAAMAPDGSRLYVAGRGLAVLDREPDTGALSGRQAIVSTPPSDSTDVAVSPDGLNVYEATPARLNVYAHATNGTLVRQQCLNADGSGDCQDLGGTSVQRLLERVRVSPDGANVYVSDGRSLMPLTRNADGTLAPLVNTRGFGSLTGFPIFDLEISPEGRRLYAGNTVFRRDPDHGRLSNPTPVPPSPALTSPGGQSEAVEIAVSPDGRTVYYESQRRIGGFLVPPTGEQLKPLSAPLGCIALGGDRGCQAAVASPGIGVLAGIGIDPSGRNFYLGANITAPPLRTFARVSGPPVERPVIGRADLKPRHAVARPGRPVRLRLTWRHPRRWRALATLELRTGGAGRVVLDRRGRRIRLRGAHGLRLVRAGFDGHGRRLTLRVVLVARRSLAGRTLTLDASAGDRRHHRQTIHAIGTLRVRR